MSSALHVAVDARDLAHDFRGIARYLRAVLARLNARDDVTIALIEPGPFRRVPRRTDVVWHPWNGTFLSTRAPAVVTFHDAAPFRFPAADARKRRNEQAPFLRSAARARAFLANSQFTVGEVERFLGVAPARQTVTPLGVEHELFAPAGSAARLPDGRPYVLFVGAIEARKNFTTLLAAHAALDADVGLVVTAGTPPPGASVHVLGRITEDELAAWYRGALALALPSLYEGFGLPLLEAMACGTPVLASRLPALGEVGADACAWIDEPADVAAWTAGLRRLIGDETLRARLRAAGLARAAGFSWERCAEATLAVLRRAAEAG